MIPGDFELEALVLDDAAGALDTDERRELRERLETLSPDARVRIARLYDLTLAIAGTAGEVPPPARIRPTINSAPEECYILSGSVTMGGRLLRVGDFHHAEGGTDHGEIRTDEGAKVLLAPAPRPHIETMRLRTRRSRSGCLVLECP